MTISTTASSNNTKGVKHAIAASFDKAAKHYEKTALVQAKIAQEGIARFSTLCPDIMNTLVDLGCGPAPSFTQLQHHCRRYIGLDLSMSMLQKAQLNVLNTSAQEGPSPLNNPLNSPSNSPSSLVNADAESLPFQTSSVNAFYSSMALQWCLSPSAMLCELNRCLHHQGAAMLAIMVDGSFDNLHQAWQALGLPSRVNRFASAEQWIRSAKAFDWQVSAEIKQFSTEHACLRDMLSSIKSVGANTKNTLANKHGDTLSIEGVSATEKQTHSPYAAFMRKTEIRNVEARLKAQASNSKAFALDYQILFLTLNNKN